MDGAKPTKKRISVQSAKGKGRKGQQLVRDTLLAAFSTLEPGDIRSTSMGAGGADLQLSPAAKRLIPYEFEVKVRARGFTPLYDALKQASGHGDLTPVAVVKQDRHQPLVVLHLKDFVSLIGGAQ